MYPEEYIREYKSLIHSGEKTIEQLISYLNNKYDIIELPKNKIPLSFIEHVMYNISIETESGVHSLRYYQVIRNERSHELYTNMLNEDTIIILEDTSKYIFSNNKRLFLELAIERGISKVDYEEEGSKLILYLTYLHHYKMKYFN